MRSAPSLVTEIQAQRMESQEAAQSSKVFNQWILGVSIAAAVVGIVGVVLAIVK